MPLLREQFQSSSYRAVGLFLLIQACLTALCSGVALDCVDDLGGAVVNGICYIFSSVEVSCTDKCIEVGTTCNEAALAMDNQGCLEVITALGIDLATTTHSWFYNFGSSIFPTLYFTSSVFDENVFRFVTGSNGNFRTMGRDLTGTFSHQLDAQLQDLLVTIEMFLLKLIRILPRVPEADPDRTMKRAISNAQLLCPVIDQLAAGLAGLSGAASMEATTVILHVRSVLATARTLDPSAYLQNVPTNDAASVAKVVVSFVQILASVPLALVVRHSDSLRYFLGGLDIANFSVPKAFSIACLIETNFYGELVYKTTAPILLAVVICGAEWIYRLRSTITNREGRGRAITRTECLLALTYLVVTPATNAALRGLPYEPRAWWFEVFETFRRIALTSLVYFAAATTSQLWMAMLLTVLSLAMNVVFSPFTGSVNDLIYSGAQYVTLVVLALALTVDAETEYERDITSELIGWAIVVLMAGYIIVALVVLAAKWAHRSKAGHHLYAAPWDLKGASSSEGDERDTPARPFSSLHGDDEEGGEGAGASHGHPAHVGMGGVISTRKEENLDNTSLQKMGSRRRLKGSCGHGHTPAADTAKAEFKNSAIDTD
eukprot:jgi/Undpi1/13290/HiC_scaffold_8.g02952.m1